MKKLYNQVKRDQWAEAEVTMPIIARYGTGGGNIPIVIEPIVFRDDITIKIDGGGIAFTLGARDYKGVQCVSYQNVTGCLSQGAHPGSYNGQDAYNDMLVTDGVFNSEIRNIQEVRSSAHDECKGLQRCNGLDNSGGGGLLSEPTMMSNRKGHNSITENGTSTTLTAQEKERPIVGTSIVRRLTPLECERLQGFPDGWTDIGEWVDSKGKKHKEADSPRYKALGNSIAIPFWQFLARRICAQYERPVTLGSLFDGIGGFPLAFERCGAKAVWASEIEEFPIAVTKIHFPERSNNG